MNTAEPRLNAASETEEGQFGCRAYSIEVVFLMGLAQAGSLRLSHLIGPLKGTLCVCMARAVSVFDDVEMEAVKKTTC